MLEGLLVDVCDLRLDVVEKHWLFGRNGNVDSTGRHCLAAVWQVGKLCVVMPRMTLARAGARNNALTTDALMLTTFVGVL